MQESKPYCPIWVEGLETNSLLDEMVVYWRDRQMMYSLNASAAAVWNLCNGRHTLMEMCEILGKQYDRPVEGLFADVSKIVALFQEWGLVH